MGLRTIQIPASGTQCTTCQPHMADVFVKVFMLTLYMPEFWLLLYTSDFGGQ